MLLLSRIAFSKKRIPNSRLKCKKHALTRGQNGQNPYPISDQNS